MPSQQQPASPQQPVEIDVTSPETVVEFGPEPQERRRRWDFSGLSRDVLADRRTVPLAAGLAALAALVSALSEWQVTVVDADSIGNASGIRTVPSGLDDLGTLGIGYVLGLFLLVPAVVLTLFGPPAARRAFRLAGLSVAGTLFGVLLAIAARLTSESYLIDPIYRIAFDGAETTLSYGRGVWCAFAAVLFALAALYLAGRHLAGAPTSEDAPEAAATEFEPAEAVWSWRRPAPGRDEQPDVEALDLTVAPSQPFTSFQDDRDRPN
ncbi:hypothetical protein [Paractinoplanes lichenicola]|uniref:Uncharacterized protein n=1 Tax=Paractinoplanes lichenicola TaxID=2802976 RepID=A0ABS1W421_9ACTN|nr:hypothetical protein [Actinoplanes lichenicola]MBL7261464.1 hypothetical protein [Actinoplanes lichenicola]